MKVEQIYTGCLAQGAYYIESRGEAAIIDPLREVEPYIKKAKERGAKIKYIFETHFHADFVSGHLDLAKKTGAEIVFGPGAKTKFEIKEASDGEVFSLGDISIKALHTPGHTPESTTYLLIDESGKEHAIFSGDTLFIGDVGRPDLAVKSDLTKEDLAGMLYDSLQEKILPLPDEVIVYPAHGAGSACGKAMSSETHDTLGHQRETNYALRAANKESFIRQVLDGILPPPQYFPKNALMNKEGYESFDSIMHSSNTPLSPDEFEQVVNSTGALMLDSRHQEVFHKQFVPNSINISLDGQFAPWAGTLIHDMQQPIVIVADAERVEETITRLARVGFENVLGYLAGGIDSWVKAGKEIDSIHAVSAEEFAEIHRNNKINILDARRPTEYSPEHIVGATNFPLDYINDNMDTLDKETEYYLHCSGGYRSMSAASILKSRGFEKLINVYGGYNAIRQTDIQLTTNQTVTV